MYRCIFLLSAIFLNPATSNTLEFTEHSFTAPDPIFTLDCSDKFAFTGSKRKIQLWDYEKFQNVRSLSASQKVLHLSYADPYLISGENYGKIEIWNTENWTTVNQNGVFESDAGIYRLKIKNGVIVVSRDNGEMNIYRKNDQGAKFVLKQTFLHNSEAIFALDFNEDYLVAVDEKSFVQVNKR